MAESDVSLLQRHKSTIRHILRFGVVGVINTCVYFGLYLLFRTIVPYLVAHLIAIALSMVVSFFLNCYWTFQTQPTWRKFLVFPLTNATNYIVSTVGVVVLVSVVGVNEVIAPLIAAFAAIPVTFVLSRRILTRTPQTSGTVSPSSPPVQ